MYKKTVHDWARSRLSSAIGCDRYVWAMPKDEKGERDKATLVGDDLIASIPLFLFPSAINP
ncbi:hypothetical protein [Spirulina sp.]|uniref:hypothetical protein n=1 Tax=Spirulina sp. TaxID=1157 RepID=UPI003F704FDE